MNGKLVLARAGDVGPVVQMLEFPHGGALIEAAKGWFLARAESGKVTLLPVVTVAPVTPGNIGRLRSMRSVPGGGVLIEATVWFMAREGDGKLTLTLAGDAATGVVDAIGDWPGGQLLIHTEQNGWFLGSAEGGKLAVKPAGNADTGRVFQMKTLGTGMLVWARNGLFVAREQGGKVTLAPAEGADTGQAFQMLELGSGLLISAEKGLFFAREQDGKVAIAPAGDAAIGPALGGGIHQLPAGGTLIGASRGGWFGAHEQGGKVTLTPAGNADTGRVALMRELAGKLLIGAEKGLFVAGPAPAGGCDAMLAQQRPAPAQPGPPPVCVVPADADTGAVHALGDYRGFMLIGADKGLFLSREANGRVTVALVPSDGDIGRVLAVRRCPGRGADRDREGIVRGQRWDRWRTHARARRGHQRTCAGAA